MRSRPHPPQPLAKVALLQSCSPGDSNAPRWGKTGAHPCLLYTSDAADDLLCVDLRQREMCISDRGERLFFLNEGHLNPRGNRTVAELLLQEAVEGVGASPYEPR